MSESEWYVAAAWSIFIMMLVFTGAFLRVLKAKNKNK